MKEKILFAIAGALLATILSAFGAKSLRPYRIEGRAQGTTYHITYYATDSVVEQAAIDSILSVIDSSLSIYKPYSLISRFNRSAKGIGVDDHLRRVMEKSMVIYRETSGISDPTVLPLVNAWGFGPEKASGRPDPAMIRQLLDCVGAFRLRLEGNRLIKSKPCVGLDLNGIAQGYSVDVVADFLETKGIGSYLVEIGGEIRLKGRKLPGGEAQSIGIDAPVEDPLVQADPYTILHPADGAITTSGNYRKFHTSGGKTVSHLIDPHSGYPFSNELLSVTVWAKDAITADGYDNALMGMGLERALAFMKKHPEMQAYFIYRKANGAASDTATIGFNKFRP